MPIRHEPSLRWCLACRRKTILRTYSAAAAQTVSLHRTRRISRAPSSRRPAQDLWNLEHQRFGEARREISDSAARDDRPKDIGIIGGGITGLTAAWVASHSHPDAKVTLFEASNRLGGWVDTQTHSVEGGEIKFEAGPRTLRPNNPNGLLVLKLVQDLQMVNDLVGTPKSSPAAQNRFIYYPDQLVKMPAGKDSILAVLIRMLTEPAFTGFFKGIFTDIMTEQRDLSLEDESVGSFISRRFSKDIASNLASALFHGIYAGDIWKLSAKQILPLQWEGERKLGNLSSVIATSVIEKSQWQFCDDLELTHQLIRHIFLPEVKAVMGCSVFGFKGGISDLTKGLERGLRRRPNVTVRENYKVGRIEYDPGKGGGFGDRVSVSGTLDDTSTAKESFDVLIHTLSPLQLARFTGVSESQSEYTPYKRSSYAPTVAVTNLYYRTPNLLQTLRRPLAGFGYLIPQSLPFEQNPERALGVIFDDDALPDIHSTVPREKRGTRLTVMFGGHWWDSWDDVPEKEDYKSMAMSLLSRHLGITEEPLVESTTIQRNCIPQYTVGHEQRMRQIHNDLNKFGGRVKVAGSWYTGVGVNDCVRAAHDVINGLSDKHWRGDRGLDRFVRGRPMVMVKRVPLEQGMGIVQVEPKGLRYFPDAPVEKDARE